MSFRGRGGRGGGRGGRGGRGGCGPSNFNFQAKHAPHEDFPEITLPEMTYLKPTTDERALIMSTTKLEDFMRTSCYHLEPDVKKRKDDKEIERFSDRKRKTRSKREALAAYLKLTSGNFPAELLEGHNRVQPVHKKLRWDKDSDEKAFEKFEKLEANHKDGENKTEKDGEDEDDEEEEEVEEQESSDDDYNQNDVFDDDEDDWNQEEEAHEDCYD
ncbi:unnamed protein product [Alopecurus aequalis]